MCLLKFNPVALRKAKILCNFGLSECNRVKSTVFKTSILGLIKSTASFCSKSKHLKSVRKISSYKQLWTYKSCYFR